MALHLSGTSCWLSVTYAYPGSNTNDHEQVKIQYCPQICRDAGFTTV